MLEDNQVQLPDSLCESAEHMLSLLMDMGELLLTSGAEILRVEDTLSRLCKAYGFARVDVFTITSSIVLTVHDQDGRVFTQTRRILTRDTNLKRVEQINNLSRQLCQQPVSAADLHTAIEKIRNTKPISPWLECGAYAVISAAFAVFFGGSWLDGVAALLSGVVVYVVQRSIQKLQLNSIVHCLLSSALTAIAVYGLVYIGIGHDAEKITIGNIMLLIPGIAFTTSLRDITNGDTISGLLGLAESVIRAMAIAIGFAGVLVVLGG